MDQKLKGRSSVISHPSHGWTVLTLIAYIPASHRGGVSTNDHDQNKKQREPQISSKKAVRSWLVLSLFFFTSAPSLTVYDLSIDPTTALPTSSSQDGITMRPTDMRKTSASPPKI